MGNDELYPRLCFRPSPNCSPSLPPPHFHSCPASCFLWVCRMPGKEIAYPSACHSEPGPSSPSAEDSTFFLSSSLLPQSDAAVTSGRIIRPCLGPRHCLPVGYTAPVPYRDQLFRSTADSLHLLRLFRSRLQCWASGLLGYTGWDSVHRRSYIYLHTILCNSHT